jgi:hypothetical protein
LGRSQFWEIKVSYVIAMLVMLAFEPKFMIHPEDVEVPQTEIEDL